MNNQIANYCRAGYSGLYIVSHEESRVEADVLNVANGIGFQLFAWSLVNGLADTAGNVIADTSDPMAMLTAFDSLPEKTVVLARDLHGVLGDNGSPASPLLVRKLKESLAIARQANRVLVIVGCLLRLPPELEKEITVVEFKLPDREELKAIANKLAESAGIKPDSFDVEAVVDAARGLTTTEAENAMALAFVETQTLAPAIIHREKVNTVKKNGLLEIVEPRVGISDIGGLEMLKSHLNIQRNLFTKAAREYGIPSPRGSLVVGQPGTGKSLTATATAKIFNLPLVRLEAGKIFGSLVGESERNWRTAFATVKAIAPCIFWIDEVDGMFSGHGGQSTDGGTTQRVLKAILQDMQFNGDEVYFFFTANEIDCLPDPLIDRLDVWSVDLPSKTEREAIWSIHIAKRGRKPSKFNLGKLAELTDGFSGRQIEQVWLKTMAVAFNEDGREPTVNDAETIAATVTPTSKTMAEAIERRRKRLANRAMPASAQEKPVATNGTRKLVK